jgi:uncharacterized protein
MTLQGSHLGMNLTVDELDIENTAYFGHCAKHDFHLQRCDECALMRYPPTTACPFCTSLASNWIPVEGKGEVHSYTEVHHGIQPQFQKQTPYLVLLVELDTQKGKPSEHDALRVVANLVTPQGQLASGDQVRRVGIGTRVRMVFNDLSPGLSLPQWTIDEDSPQPLPWRYPEP